MYGFGAPIPGLIPNIPNQAAPPSVGLPPGTATFVLPNGQLGSFIDWLDDKFFGLTELKTGDSSALYGLSGAVGDAVPGGTRTMTRVDTNLPKGGANGLPMAYEAWIFCVAVDFVRAVYASADPLTLADASHAGTQVSDPVTADVMWALSRLLELEFVYNGKALAYGTPLDFPGGRGVYYQGTTNAKDFSSNGLPSPRDRSALVIPVHMQVGEGFKMTHQPEAALVISQTPSGRSNAETYVELRTSLYGLIKVPVR